MKSLNLITVILLLICSVKAFSQDCHTPDSSPPISTQGGSDCALEINYTPDQSDAFQNTPLLVFKLNFHFFRPEDGSGTFENITFEDVEDAVSGMNWFVWENLLSPSLPVTPPAEEIPDTRIRFAVNEIFFHDDDDFIDTGESSCTSFFHNNYGVDTDEVINVYYHTSSVYTTGGGCASQSQFYANMHNSGLGGSTFTHELGHVLGLPHTFSWSALGQYCNDDIFVDTYHPDPNLAWASCGPNEPYTQCGGGVGISNNVMGYNSCRRYYSPKQLARMHYRSITNTNQRNHLACDDHEFDTDVLIIQNANWNSSKVIDGDLIVEAGSKLTIECTVYMKPSSRIVVEQNAELIIDGGRITNYCNDFWQGIELWGDSDEPQISFGGGYKPQAILRLKNGGIIENAWVGVTTAEIGNPDASGGLIDARDGEFLNNYIAVDMKPFENTSQYTGNPKGNLSSFKETKFTVNDVYIGDLETEYPEAQVKMWGVDGVTFAGCEFVNTSTVSTSEKRSKGIFSESAQYHIYSACATIPSQQTGCPTEDVIPTLFDGFNRGIEAAVYDTPLPILVRGTKFTNNMVGIELDDLSFSEIIRSEFEIGGHPHETTIEGPYQDHLGIYSNQTRCFVIEENEFYKDIDALWGEQNGIFVFQSEDNSNNVYRNDFSELKHGAIGYQVNRDDDGIIGLQFTCNDMINNFQDFVVSRNTLSPNAGDAGIREYQGNLNPTLAAGNTFSVPNGAPNDYTHWDINSDFNYHYYHSSGMAPDPNELTPNKIFPIQLQDENQCLTNYNPVGRTPAGGIEGVFQVFNQKKSEYYSLLYTYRQIIDQGDTEGTIDEIIATWPEDAWDLYDMLMARSPNNSETVLISAADREIMPHAMLLEVLLANPDALRNGRIAYHVEHNLTNPMPGYMIDILNAASNQTTMRTAMENALSHHHAEMTRNYNFIIQHYTTDTLNGINNDSLLYYLEQMDSPTGKYNLAGRLMSIGNYTGALNIIDSIPLNYKFSASQTHEWEAMKAFFELLEDANRNGRNIATLDSIELVTLELIAIDLEGGIGALRARKALCFFYQNCIDGPALPKNYSVGHQKPLPPLEELLSELDKVSAFPNPASEYVTFSFQFFKEKGERDILIYNSTGSLVQSYQINDVQQGQQLWDTRKMKPGTYIYEVLEGDRKVHSGKIVIQ